MERSRSNFRSALAGGASVISSRTIHCVLLSCFDQDVAFWSAMLCDGGIRLHKADSLEKADFALLATGGTVLLSDLRFLDGSWEHAAAMVQDIHPHVATLVCADPIDRDAPVRAQEHGAVGVLWKPLDLWRMRSAILMAHEIALDRLLWHPSPATHPCLAPGRDNRLPHRV